MLISYNQMDECQFYAGRECKDTFNDTKNAFRFRNRPLHKANFNWT